MHPGRPEKRGPARPKPGGPPVPRTPLGGVLPNHLRWRQPRLRPYEQAVATPGASEVIADTFSAVQSEVSLFVRLVTCVCSVATCDIGATGAILSTKTPAAQRR